MADEDLQLIRKEALVWRKRWNRGAKCWSSAYHISVYGVIVLSGAAALLLQLQSLEGWSGRTDVASILAGAAAIITTLSASGDFRRKWRANRKARTEMDILILEASDPGASVIPLRTRLTEAIRGQSDEISAEGTEAHNSRTATPPGDEKTTEISKATGG